MQTSRPMFVEVSFGGASMADGVRRVRLLESEFGHEQAVIFVEEKSPTSKRFASGAPVAIRWGKEPNAVEDFVGYVSHTEPQHDRSQGKNGTAPLLKVFCVSPTWAAKDQGYRTYRNALYSEVISAIGGELRLDLQKVRRSDRRASVLHQSGKSDWEFMVQCAKEIGWTLFARGVSLHCLDRRTLITETSSQAPLLRPAQRGGAIEEFKPSLGATSPKGGDLAKRAAYSVNPHTGAVLAVGGRAGQDKGLFGRPPVPVFQQAKTGLSFDSLGEAQALMGAEVRLNQLTTTAYVSGASIPRARVGRTVAVAGYGEDADGYWYVIEAEHEIQGQNKSRMTLTLGRDSEIAALQVDRPALSTRAPARSPRLLNGRWVAA